MVKAWLALIVAGFAILSPATVRAQPAPAGSSAPDELIHVVTVREVRALLLGLGASVEQVEGDAPDEFQLVGTFADGLMVTFWGMTCGTPYEGLACPEYRMAVAFEVRDSETAAATAPRVQTYYVSADARGDQVILSRMGFTYGGITREHLRRTISEYLVVVRKLWDDILPPEPTPTETPPADS